MFIISIILIKQWQNIIKNDFENWKKQNMTKNWKFNIVYSETFVW